MAYMTDFADLVGNVFAEISSFVVGLTPGVITMLLMTAGVSVVFLVFMWFKKIVRDIYDA